MSDTRRFDSLEKVVKDTARKLDDTRSTALSRIATHSHQGDDLTLNRVASNFVEFPDGTSAVFGTNPVGAPKMWINWNGSNFQFMNNSTGLAVKTFIIDHPTNPEQYLVHATTESPYNGVEYWGEVVVAGGTAAVDLPTYFEDLCSLENRQVQVSAVLSDEGDDVLCQVAASPPKNGKFRIACSGPDGTKVAWLVKAVRKDVPPLLVEPLKDEVSVYGDGPYRYYVTPEAE